MGRQVDSPPTPPIPPRLPPTFDAAAQLRTQQALTDVLALPAAALGLLGVAVTTGPPANRRAVGALQNLTVIQHVTLQAHYRVVPVGARAGARARSAGRSMLAAAAGVKRLRRYSDNFK